ncbi:MAG: sulfotransferase [Pseudomonadota bacterium]
MTPNLFLIGGMRCGSTTLNLLLSQHPSIYMSPVKEPCFFIAEYMRRELAANNGSIESVRAYEEMGKHRTRTTYDYLFENVQSERWIGEASHYLYAPDVRGVIKELSPDARIVVSFRDPTERLVSEYGRLIRDNKTQETLDEFVLRGTTVEGGRIVDYGGESKLGRGLQAHLVMPWLETFGRERVRFVFFEDLNNDPTGLASDLFGWLGIDTMFAPKVVHTQRGGHMRLPKLQSAMNSSLKASRYVKRLLPRLVKERIRASVYKKAVAKPTLQRDLEKSLRNFYRSDVVRLQEISQRDLSEWM